MALMWLHYLLSLLPSEHLLYFSASFSKQVSSAFSGLFAHSKFGSYVVLASMALTVA